MALSVLPSTLSVNAAPTKVPENVLTEKGVEDLERKIVGYFPEWAYKSEAQGYFNMTDLQWDELTHIQYSFAMVDPTTNKIAFGDKHAAIEEDFSDFTDEQLTYKGKVIELDSTLPYKGHFNHMQTLKKENPNVDLLISIGGWAGSRGFYTMLDTDQGIETFANSCVDFIREYGFDGVDIDFEYPSATSQSGNPDDLDLSEPRRKTINARYNKMMKVLREKIDQASKQDGKDYLLTAAVTASSWVLGGVSDNSYAKELDFLSVMSYDFHGGWNEFVENQANIYPDPADTETIQMMMPVLNMDWAYRYYRGVLPPEKILMGIPYYTRGWENVNGGDGTGLHGKSKTPASGKYNIWGDDLDGDGKLEPAGANPLWHVLNLMDQDKNLTEHWDDAGKVPHVWQGDEKVFLSFENERSIEERLKFIQEKNLGGALIWVMNGDYDLNPNYVPGSTNVNEGKYTYGNTLTKKLSDGLDKMGPCSLTDDSVKTDGEIAVGVEMTGNYDHPNYTYSLNVTNYSNETIPGGWTVSFDLPNSAIYKSSWGGQATQTPNGEFTTITITAGAWHGMAPGETVTLQGMIGLCFSGVRNITFNGFTPVGNAQITPPTENAKPVISGTSNKEIKIGDKFDPMAGVTATDKEDGDLTSKITVTGSVDINKAGTYKLTYSVTDSNNQTITSERTITVIDNTAPPTNTDPVLNGVSDKEIKVGDKFDAMAGVTATDKEDGDLTSKVIIIGSVDTTKAGIYNLTYSVTDSKNATTTKVRKITVKATTPEVGDNFDINKIYNAGDVVVYKGQQYKVKWWTQGAYPDKSDAFELLVEANPDGSLPYVSGKAYTGGQKVSYNGNSFEAKWWTTSTPGSDDSWKKL
ncbi:MAG: glycosyl hydrolase family 18 protein [Sarcina sp.]